MDSSQDDQDASENSAGSTYSGLVKDESGEDKDEEKRERRRATNRSSEFFSLLRFLPSTRISCL